jgi:hypothetical protein
MQDRKNVSGIEELDAARRKGPAEERQYIANNQDICNQKRDISGFVSFGRDAHAEIYEKAGVDAKAAVFIEEGWNPNPELAYGGFVAGLIMWGICAITLKKLRKV